MAVIADSRPAPFRCVAAGLLAAMAVVLAPGCATLPEDFERPVSRAPLDTADTTLGQAARARQAEHPGEAAGFRPLPDGVDALVARAALARMAERTIDAQYYLLHDDLTGWLFIHELLRAADRGVRVRLLVDDMAIPRRDDQMAAFAAHPNVHVRVFNPFSRRAARATQFITRFGSVTRRMHNKSFTADNQYTILGGRNIGDEYFDAGPAMAYSDLDVVVVGPPVRAVSRSFDEYWNSELSYPIEVLAGEVPGAAAVREGRARLERFVESQRDSAYAVALRESDLANLLRAGGLEYYWGDAEVVVDEPEKILEGRDERDTHLLPRLRPYFDELSRELVVIAAYFVPGRRGTDYLVGLRERGVRVRVLTNSLSATDVTPVHAGYSRYRKDLLRAGVELFEMKASAAAADGTERAGRREPGAGLAGSSKASLHAKSFVLDRERVFIGSLNLDPRSADENTEIGVVMQNREMASRMAEWFDANLERIAYRVELCAESDPCRGLRWHDETAEGGPVVYEKEPETGFWQRLSVRLYRLLPFESQL